jgi:hypothetical protein
MRNAPNGNLLGRHSAAFGWTPVAIVVIAAVQGGASASFEVENDFHLPARRRKCDAVIVVEGVAIGQL